MLISLWMGQNEDNKAQELAAQLGCVSVDSPNLERTLGNMIVRFATATIK